MKKIKFAALISAMLLLSGALTPPQVAGAKTSSAYRAVNGVNLDILNADSTITPKPVMATIFNATSCPEYIFFGVRGSGEGYQYSEVKQIGVIPATKWTPERVQYGDDAKSNAYFWTDAKKQVHPRPGYGIGTTLAKVFVALQSNDKFIGRIAAAAPRVSQSDLGGGYNAPPVSALGAGEASADNYIKSMFVNGVFSSINSILYTTKACPNSKLILSGYSQGAFIVSSSINTLRKYSWGPSTLKAVKAVALLADPAAKDAGLVAELKAFQSNVTLRGQISSLVDSAAKFCGNDVECQRIGKLAKKLLTYSTLLSAPIDSSNLTRFANNGTVQPKSTNEMSIKNFSKDDDFVADTAGVISLMKPYIPKSVNACWNDKKCVPNLIKIADIAEAAFEIHASYGEPESEWAAKNIVPWLASQKTLK